MGRVKRITAKGKASRVKDLEAAEYVNAIIMDSEMLFSLSFSLSLFFLGYCCCCDRVGLVKSLLLFIFSQ